MVWKNLITGIYLMIIGMGVVFVALFLLMELINAIGLVERLGTRLFKKPAVAPVLAQEGMSDEEVAVICAAAAEALAAKVEVHHIRMLQDEYQDAWSRMGRLDIMRSHNIHTPKQ